MPVAEKLPFTVIICGGARRRRRCRWCSAPSTKLCDFKAPGAKRTCDASMCDRHAKSIGPDLDRCPDHA